MGQDEYINMDNDRRLTRIGPIKRANCCLSSCRSVGLQQIGNPT